MLPTYVFRLVLLALPLAAYVPIWENKLIDWDDEQIITTNPYITNGLTWEDIRWAWTSHVGPYWMPLTNLSFQLDASVTPGVEPAPAYLSGLCPAMFHGQNLFWHCCNVQLLFGLMRRFGGSPGQAFLLAGLFAVHPMHVESVAWAIERKDVLMCFFGLLSIGCYLRYVEKSGWVRWAYYAAMLAAYQANMLCKPMLMTFPCVLLLLDYWPLRRWRLRGTPPLPGDRRPANLGALILEKIPVFVIALAMMAQTLATRPVQSMTDLTLLDMAINACAGYRNYVVATFYPINLAILYPHPGKVWPVVESLTGLGLLVLVSGFAVYRARSLPWLPVGWFWFLGTLVPVIGFKQGGQQAWADRFSYWPHIGLFIAIVWAATAIGRRLGLPAWLRAGGCAAVLACLAALTWVQIGYWQNTIVVWTHAAAVTKNNQHAHEHISMTLRREGRIEEADHHLHLANRLAMEKRKKELGR